MRRQQRYGRRATDQDETEHPHGSPPRGPSRLSRGWLVRDLGGSRLQIVEPDKPVVLSVGGDR
ncbi:MAG TPA: hypothetical protein VE673_18960 [Pseudonocardiaceae bacterium]|nr:hypothetical protein [Pseudonocardiaceae bacterium]